LQGISALGDGLTPYDRLKQLYDAAQSPQNIQSVFNRIKYLNTCSEVSSDFPDYPLNLHKLALAEHIVPGNGPEFPGKKENAIVLISTSKNIDHDDLSYLDFIQNFKATLTAQELQVVTTLVVSRPIVCQRYDISPDGNVLEDENCHGQIDDGILPLRMNLRVDSQYVLYQMQNSKKKNVYGYCWN
jgi:hypothetical protein